MEIKFLLQFWWQEIKGLQAEHHRRKARVQVIAYISGALLRSFYLHHFTFAKKSRVFS